MSVKLKGLTLEEIASKFFSTCPLETRLRLALKELGDAAVDEETIRQRVKTSFKELHKVRAQFAGNVLEVRMPRGRPQYLWCGTERFAALARKRLGEQL